MNNINKISRINKIKGLTLTLFAVLILITSLQAVLAIGISPGRAVYNFESGREETVEFKVTNNEHKDMKVLFYVEGELNGSITIYEKMVEFTSSETEKTFKYSFKLPQHIDGPGIHETRIVAMELPKDVAEPGTFIGATVAVATQLYIKVPYPGKYLEAKIDIVESDVNGTTKFVIAASNLGDQKIARAFATIDILSKTNEKIASLKTETLSIDAKKRKELVVEWKTDVNPGAYIAKAVIVYDEKTLEIEKSFAVGNLRLELIDVVIEDFRLGGIAKFTILTENKWNGRLENVYAQVLIFDQAGKTIADSKSASTNINALAKATLFAYWDTAGIDAGDYEGKIVLHYADQTAEKEIRAHVRENELVVDIMGITAKAVSKGEKAGKASSLLVILVVILILINVLWFLYFRKKIKK